MHLLARFLSAVEPKFRIRVWSSFIKARTLFFTCYIKLFRFVSETFLWLFKVFHKLLSLYTPFIAIILSHLKFLGCLHKIFLKSFYLGFILSALVLKSPITFYKLIVELLCECLQLLDPHVLIIDLFCLLFSELFETVCFCCRQGKLRLDSVSDAVDCVKIVDWLLEMLLVACHVVLSRLKLLVG